jgi:hypothetical protein
MDSSGGSAYFIDSTRALHKSKAGQAFPAAGPAKSTQIATIINYFRLSLRRYL